MAEKCRFFIFQLKIRVKTWKPLHQKNWKRIIILHFVDAKAQKMKVFAQESLAHVEIHYLWEWRFLPLKKYFWLGSATQSKQSLFCELPKVRSLEKTQTFKHQFSFFSFSSHPSFNFAQPLRFGPAKFHTALPNFCSRNESSDPESHPQILPPEGFPLPRASSAAPLADGIWLIPL